MLTIAVDPGLKTGIAGWNDEEHTFYSLELDPEEVYQHLTEQIEAHFIEVRLVAESFLITTATAKNTQAPWSLELIGVCRYLTWRYSLEPLVLQQPSVGKAFGSDAKLRQLGWYKGSRGGLAGHADDAARHLLTFGATRGRFFTTGQLIELAEIA